MSYDTVKRGFMYWFYQNLDEFLQAKSIEDTYKICEKHFGRGADLVPCASLYAVIIIEKKKAGILITAK